MEKIKPTILDLRISAQIFSRFLLVFSITSDFFIGGGVLFVSKISNKPTKTIGTIYKITKDVFLLLKKGKS